MGARDVSRETVRLTAHALTRCTEMGVSTDRVARALQPMNRSQSWPGPRGDDRHVRSALEPGLLFVVADRDPSIVITVLHWSPDRRRTREEGAP